MKIMTFNNVDYKVDERFEEYNIYNFPSSNVEFFGNLPEEGAKTERFFIQFKNGSSYCYEGVPVEIIKKAISKEIDSIGKFLRAEVTGKFPSVKLTNSILTPNCTKWKNCQK